MLPYLLEGGRLCRGPACNRLLCLRIRCSGLHHLFSRNVPCRPVDAFFLAARRNDALNGIPPQTHTLQRILPCQLRRISLPAKICATNAILDVGQTRLLPSCRQGYTLLLLDFLAETLRPLTCRLGHSIRVDPRVRIALDETPCTGGIIACNCGLCPPSGSRNSKLCAPRRILLLRCPLRPYRILGSLLLLEPSGLRITRSSGQKIGFSPPGRLRHLRTPAVKSISAPDIALFIQNCRPADLDLLIRLSRPAGNILFDLLVLALHVDKLTTTDAVQKERDGTACRPASRQIVKRGLSYLKVWVVYPLLRQVLRDTSKEFLTALGKGVDTGILQATGNCPDGLISGLLRNLAEKPDSTAQDHLYRQTLGQADTATDKNCLPDLVIPDPLATGQCLLDAGKLVLSAKRSAHTGRREATRDLGTLEASPHERRPLGHTSGGHEEADEGA